MLGKNTCRSDICTDIGNDCCAPGGESRGCSIAGYEVQADWVGSCFVGAECVGSSTGQESAYQCCLSSGHDHWWDYYHEEDDDDDDDGATELVMSGGLVAIGITFTGITIAAIANAVQEQCAPAPRTSTRPARRTSPYHQIYAPSGPRPFRRTRCQRRLAARLLRLRGRVGEGQAAAANVQGLTATASGGNRYQPLHQSLELVAHAAPTASLNMATPPRRARPSAPRLAALILAEDHEDARRRLLTQSPAVRRRRRRETRVA